MHRVFKRPGYIFLAALTAVIMAGAILWIPATPLMTVYLLDPALSGAETRVLIENLLIRSVVDTAPSVLLYTFVMAVLVGINIALLAFYLQLYHTAPTIPGVAGGFLGAFFAFLGFGCASCGTIFLSALSAAASGVGLYALSPYLGIGIGVIGIALLIVSSMMLARAINKPPVCPI